MIANSRRSRSSPVRRRHSPSPWCPSTWKRSSSRRARVPARDLNNGVGSAYTAAEIADQAVDHARRHPQAAARPARTVDRRGIFPLAGSTRASTASPSTARCSRTTSASARAPMRPATRRSTSTPSSPRPWPRRTIPSAPRASPAASSMSRPSRAPTNGTARRFITFTAATRWVGENRASLVLDIENVLNLLNDEWGTFDAGPGFGPAAIVRADLVSVADVAALGIDAAPALAGDAPRTTCVRRSDCVYRFNSFRNVAAAFPAASRSVHRIGFGFRIDL